MYYARDIRSVKLMYASLNLCERLETSCKLVMRHEVNNVLKAIVQHQQVDSLAVQLSEAP